jgi:hypothetical protein
VGFECCRFESTTDFRPSEKLTNSAPASQSLENTDILMYRVFQKELYNFERFNVFIQRTYTVL